MVEDNPYIPPGADDGEGDVLGKLDDLLNRHKPPPQDPQAAPVLTDALPEEDASGIPTLTDIVSRPQPSAREPAAQSGLDSALVQRLAMRLEVERARLLGEAGSDPVRTELLNELITRLRESLADIVQVAIGREERRTASKPEDENR